MFDANMRYIPEGHEFFAEFRGVDEDHPLKAYSERYNVVLCKMLSSESENPTVRFFLDNGFIDVSSYESGCGSWIIYAGLKDGSDFISEEMKRESMYILRGNK